jgi:hypothetical protein
MDKPVEQPMPVDGKDLVIPVARELFAWASAVQENKGLAKYGKPLQTHNGRDPLDDIIFELTDAIHYLAQAKMERAEMSERLKALQDIAAEQLWDAQRLWIGYILDNLTHDRIDELRNLTQTPFNKLSPTWAERMKTAGRSLERVVRSILHL